MVVRIKELPIEERPFEKLINNGVSTLTNEELLAILIHTGTSKYSAKEVASILLKQFNSISDLKNTNYKILTSIKGIVHEKLLFIGTINYSVVHPREIFKEAYYYSASGIICVHNHPSNNLVPSSEDINITKALISVGNILGIKVIDHLIIGSNNYYSFLENGDI